ncbi:DUF4330 family protein [Treponema sp. R6D11]
MKKLNWFDWILVTIFAIVILGGAYYFLKPKAAEKKAETVPIEITAQLENIQFAQQKTFLEGFTGAVTIGETKQARGNVIDIETGKIDDTNFSYVVAGQKVGLVEDNWLAQITITADAVKTDRGYFINGEPVVPGKKYDLIGKGLNIKPTILFIKEGK